MTILDQFDIEPTVGLSGSYSDLILYGNSDLLGFDNNRPRMVVGVKSIQQTASLSLGTTNISYIVSDLRALLDGAGFGSNRFYQAFTPNFVDDSVLPTPVDIVLVNSGSPILNGSWNGFTDGSTTLPTLSAFSSFSLLIGLTHTNPPLTASAPEPTGGKRQISDDAWAYSFPFEYKYKDLPRYSQVNNVLNNPSQCFTTSSQASTTAYYLTNSLGLIGTSPNFTTTSVNIHASNGIVNTAALLDGGISAGGLGVTTYGKQTFNLLTWYSIGDFHSRLPYDDSQTSTLNFAARGFKYGIHNPLPIGLKAIFRRNRFGQLRDMLEPLPIIKMFNPTNLTNIFLAGPVEQSFISGSDSFITASNPILNVTVSGRYDRFARAGKPFDDTL